MYYTMHWATSCELLLSHVSPSAQVPVSRKAQKLFRGANFKIKTSWISAQFLVHKPVNFALLTDSNSLYHFQNYLNLEYVEDGKCKTAFRAQKVTRTFEKQAPAYVATFTCSHFNFFPIHLFSSPEEVIFMHTHEFYPLNYPWQKWGTICGFGCRKKLIFPLHK